MCRPSCGVWSEVCSPRTSKRLSTRDTCSFLPRKANVPCGSIRATRPLAHSVASLHGRGCGMHVESTLAGVPLEERCKCPRAKGGNICLVQTQDCLSPESKSPLTDSTSTHPIDDTCLRAICMRLLFAFHKLHLSAGQSLDVDIAWGTSSMHGH